MTAPKTALLLVGSAKPAGQSTSEALGSYLAQKLAERDITITTMHVARALRTEERTVALLAAVDAPTSSSWFFRSMSTAYPTW